MGREVKSRCLTIVISALNEEELIGLMVNEVLPVVRGVLDAFEVILVDDGSTDKTGEIMDELAEANPEVQVVHNPRPGGLGGAFRKGITRARFDSLVLLTGDREITVDGFRGLIEAVGSADLILGYRDNQVQARLPYRLVISRLFQFVMMVLFGYRIRDFHGVPIYPVQAVRDLEVQSDGYPFQVETLVKLLRRNVRYVEVPFSINKEEPGHSYAVRLKTFIDFGRMAWHLLRP